MTLHKRIFVSTKGKLFSILWEARATVPLCWDLLRQDPAAFPPGEPLTMDAEAPQAPGLPLGSLPTSQLLGQMQALALYVLSGRHKGRACEPVLG